MNILHGEPHKVEVMGWAVGCALILLALVIL